jgi:hypothetical protein
MAVKEVLTTGWSPVITGDDTYVTKTMATNNELSTDTVSPVTPAIFATSKLSGSQILVFINITTGGDDVACDMFMEISPDGTNFNDHGVTGQDYITISSDIEPNVTGYKVYLVDLRTFRAPCFRIGINSAGLDIAKEIRFQFGYSYLI